MQYRVYHRTLNKEMNQLVVLDLELDVVTVHNTYFSVTEYVQKYSRTRLNLQFLSIFDATIVINQQ